MIHLKKTAGTGDGERQLNGPQTTGRAYANLSIPEFHIDASRINVPIPVRDRVELLADIFLPSGGPAHAAKKFPALLAASPYPRQIQNSGAPMGFVEAGATDFFVPRGYAHVILNARGTNGSGGTYDAFGAQERRDLHDAIEWIAAQPWCDGNVGMIGISAFAMSQVAAAVEQPPHLRAIFPVGLSADTYEAFWHGGLLSATFALNWIRAVAIFANLEDKFLRGKVVDLGAEILRSRRVHASFAHHNGESALALLGFITRKDPSGPWAALLDAASILNPVKSAFWQERDSLALMSRIRVPVYLGCDWENVPMHLPSTFASLHALSPDVPVRVAMLGRFGLTWPWESLHVEALAWFDHWLKERETGIMDGPPVRYVIPGENHGDPNTGWHEAAAWPPPEARPIEFALCRDGALAHEEGARGVRSYVYAAPPYASMFGKHDATLEWTTAPLDADLVLVGPVEVTLDAASSAGDTSFILALQDVAADDTAVDVTAGWRRAAISDDFSALRDVPSGVECRYRIPLVDNARRFAKGHRIRLILRGDDNAGAEPMMGFRHQPVGMTTRVTVTSSSRLKLSVLPRG
ncbi:MAG: CocE/NonD family hydrolase [Xanthobacteraceae bacterium]